MLVQLERASRPNAGLQRPSVHAMSRALDVCVADPGARQAAFDLVCELMSSSGATMATGLAVLQRLFFDQQVRGRVQSEVLPSQKRALCSA